jgi:hypothetical protein
MDSRIRAEHAQRRARRHRDVAARLVAIRMLASIEATFNDIWGVTRGRNWLLAHRALLDDHHARPAAIIGALGLAGGPQLQAAKTLVGKMPFIGN